MLDVPRYLLKKLRIREVTDFVSYKPSGIIRCLLSIAQAQAFYPDFASPDEHSCLWSSLYEKPE
jgi:hypothetical protein